MESSLPAVLGTSFDVGTEQTRSQVYWCIHHSAVETAQHINHRESRLPSVFTTQKSRESFWISESHSQFLRESHNLYSDNQPLPDDFRFMYEKNPCVQNSNCLPGDEYTREPITNTNNSMNIRQNCKKLSRSVYWGQEKLFDEIKEDK